MFKEDKRFGKYKVDVLGERNIDITFDANVNVNTVGDGDTPQRNAPDVDVPTTASNNEPGPFNVNLSHLPP